MAALEEFKRRLPQDWLIPFCAARGYSHEGFDGRAVEKLSAVDAADFMQAIDSGLVRHRDGTMSANQSKAKEQIFTQGLKDSVPRKVTLWLEPIITIAGLMRLHRDFQWPANRLGLQSKYPWAFDLVGYSSEDPVAEHLVCEVKKTVREVDVLLEKMLKHLNTPARLEHEFKAAEKNAFKKVLALRTSAAKVFWALGPNGYSKVFYVVRDENGVIDLRRADISALLAST